VKAVELAAATIEINNMNPFDSRSCFADHRDKIGGYQHRILNGEITRGPRRRSGLGATNGSNSARPIPALYDELSQTRLAFLSANSKSPSTEGNCDDLVGFRAARGGHLDALPGSFADQRARQG